MYSVFGSDLPSINSQAPHSAIQEWKGKFAVKNCYYNLFRKIYPDQPATYMSKIVEKLRKENKSPSNIQIAYAISICETYLSPENQTIQITEAVIKPKIAKNLVSFNLTLHKC